MFWKQNVLERELHWIKVWSSLGESDFGGKLWVVYTYVGFANSLKELTNDLPCEFRYVYMIRPCHRLWNRK